jgi:hypothetical protein
MLRYLVPTSVTSCELCDYHHSHLIGCHCFFVGSLRTAISGFGHALNIETLVAAAGKRDKPIEVFWFDTYLGIFCACRELQRLHDSK